MMWLRKSKKGFTLIELMVVVAIIGILALLGLRVYIGQMNKSKNAIVIANASTIHTLIQGDMLDHDYATEPTGDELFVNLGGATTSHVCTDLANMKNPYLGDIAIMGDIGTDGSEGEVVVEWISENEFNIQGVGAGPEATGEVLTAIQ